jgi:hypothetical protein
MARTLHMLPHLSHQAWKFKYHASVCHAPSHTLHASYCMHHASWTMYHTTCLQHPILCNPHYSSWYVPTHATIIYHNCSCCTPHPSPILQTPHTCIHHTSDTGEHAVGIQNHAICVMCLIPHIIHTSCIPNVYAMHVSHNMCCTYGMCTYSIPSCPPLFSSCHLRSPPVIFPMFSIIFPAFPS